MSLADFFSPISITQLSSEATFYNSQFGKVIQVYEDVFPDLEDTESKPQIALIGVEEDRDSVNNIGTKKAPHVDRKHLYHLYQGDYQVKIADLGNIRAGETINDTYVALKTVVEELVKQDILPVIIGGGQDLTYAQYTAYEGLEQRVEVAVIDAKFDLDQDNGENTELNSNTYLNHIILHQ